MKRRMLTGFAAVAAAAAALVTPAGNAANASNTASVSRPHLARGQAYMGWSMAGTAGSTTRSLSAVPMATTPRVRGMDVSAYQGNVNWRAYWNWGFRFAYTKATEGTYYKNPYFGQQYTGSYRTGMLRGAYHFATPNTSSGGAQANYFVSRGGGWSRDGHTLPGVLDLESNPYGNACYGKTWNQMFLWIRSFVMTYYVRTHRFPIIYTSTRWWAACTGNTPRFAPYDALWIASYSSTRGPLPRGWSYQTFWQWTPTPIDQNWFNGTYYRLEMLAR